jgi:hypothetical protein
LLETQHHRLSFPNEAHVDVELSPAHPSLWLFQSNSNHTPLGFSSCSSLSSIVGSRIVHVFNVTNITIYT